MCKKNYKVALVIKESDWSGQVPYNYNFLLKYFFHEVQVELGSISRLKYQILVRSVV